MGGRARQPPKWLLPSSQEKAMDDVTTLTTLTSQLDEAGKQLSCMNAALTDLQPQTEPECQTEPEIIDTGLRVNRLTAIGNNMFSCGPADESRSGPRRGAKPLRFPIQGEIIDVNGDWWDVRDVRSTTHGFDLCFGAPANDHGAFRGGLPRLIATKPLWDFWEANQTKGHGFLFDLPAGSTTLKRLRRRLGFNFHDDTREFWTDRIEDLDSLRPSEFAAKHGVGPLVVFDWRRKILGTRARPLGWWRKAKVRRILLSGLTLIAMGRKLGIGTSHASRLRERARLEVQLLSTPVSRKLTLAKERNRVRG
jgi:hypothetical protein